MVAGTGFEPVTFRLRGGFVVYSLFVNQVLAALAEFEINMIRVAV
jgi:hypothetical protein